jgi:hypothetical protein
VLLLSLVLLESLVFVELSVLVIVLVFVLVSVLVLVLVLLESFVVVLLLFFVFVELLVLVFVELSCFIFEPSLAFGLLAAPLDWVDVAVALWVLVPAVSALLLLVGFANTGADTPKASAIAVAIKVLFIA